MNVDYDIASQLDQLIDVLQRTDWWMFGITAVNTIAVIALTMYIGLKQKRIQEIQQQIQREQLRIERMRPLREIYAYITDFRAKTESFCRDVYMLMFHVISDQPEQNALKQLNGMKEELNQSFIRFQQLRADLIVQQGIQKNLNEIEDLYVIMNHILDVLTSLLCHIYGTYLFDKVEESEKAEYKMYYAVIDTVNKLYPNYPITSQTPLKDIQGQDLAEMIALIKKHLRQFTDVDLGAGVDVHRVENIDNTIRPFNPVFADAINEMLIAVINMKTRLFRGKDIVKSVEEEIFKA